MKHLRAKPWNKNKTGFLYLCAFLLLLFSGLFGILYGATELGLSELIDILFFGDAESPAARIFLYVRFPRVLAAFTCGAALAVSGGVIQGVLANRLASPSIIGVNAGAGLAVTVSTALGIFGGWRLALFAFLGAFLSAMLVSFGARKWGASRGTVILMGVALNCLLGAISDTVITLIPDTGVLSNDFRVGSFSSVTYQKLLPALAVTLVVLVLLFTLSNELEVLALGDESAKGLGLNTNRMRMLFLLFAALLSGAAVSVCGLLSFVGLLVPHAVRRIAGTRSKHLLPLSALLGAGFVALCDTLSRVLFSPYEIPVGIMMAFLGAPFFLFILVKGKGGHSRA